MKNISRLLCVIVFLWAGSAYSEVFAGRVVLGNDATILTTQFPTLNNISVSDLSQLTFNALNADQLSFRVFGQASSSAQTFVSLTLLNLRIYNPETGEILATLTLKPESMALFNSSGTFSRSAVFTFNDFNGLLPQNQELAFAIDARMSCNCAASGSIIVVSTPEPATMLLLPSGVAALAWVLRRRKSHL
jgi:hypothetical protein